MICHLYSDRLGLTLEEIKLMAEAQFGWSDEGCEITFAHVTEIVRDPRYIKPVEHLLWYGKSSSKLVVIQNDLDEPSLKRSLESKLPKCYSSAILAFDKAVKSNTIAL